MVAQGFNVCEDKFTLLSVALFILFLTWRSCLKSHFLFLMKDLFLLLQNYTEIHGKLPWNHHTHTELAKGPNPPLRFASENFLTAPIPTSFKDKALTPRGLWDRSLKNETMARQDILEDHILERMKKIFWASSLFFLGFVCHTVAIK